MRQVPYGHFHLTEALMTPRQRVHAALRREPTDRVPIFMWFHPETAARLANLLEVPPAHVGEAMGNDVAMTWVNNNYAMEGIVHERAGEGHTDDWGIRWVKEGPYNQIDRFPLAEATREEVLAYRFPYERDSELLALMEPVAALAERLFIGCDVSPCVFEMYWRLRGLGAAVEEIAADPELTDTMYGRCADFAVRMSELACDRYPLDWLWTGDDVASQSGLIMSPRSWRRLVRPHLARVFAVGTSRGLPVAYHCCGALRPIIGDLVEMGLSVLNPIQHGCPGMDAFDLKREFGAHLTFMGGVDTIDLLPHGSAAEVERETARLIEGMTSDGGGYILAASHTVPPETPTDNILAMYSAARLSREAILDAAASIRARLRSGE
jgi:uroporphyrinogen decarboxylase